MQVTEQQYGELKKVYTMIGAVAMAMESDGLETTQLRIAGFIRQERVKTDEPDIKMVRQYAICMPET